MRTQSIFSVIVMQRKAESNRVASTSLYHGNGSIGPMAALLLVRRLTSISCYFE